MKSSSFSEFSKLVNRQSDKCFSLWWYVTSHWFPLPPFLSWSLRERHIWFSVRIKGMNLWYWIICFHASSLAFFSTFWSLKFSQSKLTIPKYKNAQKDYGELRGNFSAIGRVDNFKKFTGCYPFNLDFWTSGIRT